MRKNKFLNVLRDGDVYLLHNTLHGTMAKVKCSLARSLVDALEGGAVFEYDQTDNFHKMLKDSHMVVDDGVNETNLLNYYYTELSKRGSLDIKLIVTRQCNFRCTYCYESFVDEKMGNEVYENLLIAIEKEAEHKGYKVVNIEFFGGEPLLEFEAICEFMENVQILAKAKGFVVNGSITTNAYYLSLDKLTKLVELNVLLYQITVDGLKENHDKSRISVDFGGTWDTIINNLLDAKKSWLSYKMLIRTNFDSILSNDYGAYLNFMAKNFSGDGRFDFLFKAVKDLGIQPDSELVKCDEEPNIIMGMTRLSKKLNLKVQYMCTPFSGMCYAAKSNSLVVDTGGALLKCTVTIDFANNVVGKLTTNGFEIDDDKICNWTSYNLQSECYDCSILPLCYGKICPLKMQEPEVYDTDKCKTKVSIYENQLKALFLDRSEWTEQCDDRA